MGTCMAKLAHKAFQDPVIKLKNIKLCSVGLSGGKMKVIIDVFNPNSMSLKVSRLTYELSKGSDGTRIGGGAHEEGKTFPPKTSEDVTIEFSFTYSGLGAAAKSLLKKGAVAYIISGEITIGKMVIPYKAKESFELNFFPSKEQLTNGD